MAGNREQKFVNPYQFLPTAPVKRGEPCHHDGRSRGELFSGTITTSWELLTPLLLPAEHQAWGWSQDGTFRRLPGSSVRGVVRSLHEALFNGCLRVFDPETLPGQRMPVTRDLPHGMRLARVIEVADGSPTEVQLAGTDTTWIDAVGLTEAYERELGKSRTPRAGDLVYLEGGVSQSNLPGGRLQMTSVRSARLVTVPAETRIDELPRDQQTGGLPWIFLPTDTAARKGVRTPGTGGCFWAAAELTEQEAVVPPEVAAAFKAVCVGSRDYQKRNSPQRETAREQKVSRYEAVNWWRGQSKEPIAERVAATGSLTVGDVVWVRLDREQQVAELRLALAWRKAGSVKAGERLPGGAADADSLGDRPLPCQPGDSVHLCLSCAIFGAVDAVGGRAKTGTPSSYASHVRFSAAIATTLEGRPGLQRVQRLAPMGSPHPSAGGFYLEPRPVPNHAAVGERGASWGGTIDAGSPRQIRGRKFYWHSDPKAQQRHWSMARPRYEASPDQTNDKMVRPAELVPAGTVLECEIAVDQLDEVAVRTLLLALDPTPLLRLARPTLSAATVHFGGGKPFGLGSAQVLSAATRVDLTSSRSRYSSDPTDSQPDWDAPLKSFAAAVQERVGRFTSNVPPLSRLLDPEGLAGDANVVSYPPAAPWSSTNDRDFRNSYEFFRQSDGLVMERSTGPLRTLPKDPIAPDQTLPIVERKRRR